MKGFAVFVLPLLAATVLLSCSGKTAASSATSSSSSRDIHTRAATSMERPLILKPDEGEARTWRPLPTRGARKRTLSEFMIKIDRQNGGSQQFWFGTSIIPVGAGINLHRHLHEDEMLYIGSGSARVHLGSLDQIAPAGSMVFIPRNTWVSLKNVGPTPISLLYGFNAPGFDTFMRCESVPFGKPARPLSEAEDAHCIKLGDVQYR